jgi:phenylacetate-CoA ligase
MPLILFKIGDRGVLCDDGLVKRLARVSGRVTDHFVLSDGSLVHGEYFTHLFYFRDWVKRFQNMIMWSVGLYCTRIRYRRI